MDDFKADIEAVNSIEAVPTILDVVCRTTGMGFAAVARVTEKRWIACTVLDKIQFGLKPGSELRIETTICNEIRQCREPVVIDHVAEDEAFRNHPTPALYGFQSYISMPILLKDGTFFGTLCAIDPKPARLKTPETIGMFKLFAELVAFHLEAQEKLVFAQSELREERQSSELREQFIAVLGHDLRNPLGAISSGAMLLDRMALGERATAVVGLIRESATRMVGLIENVLDFARGRLGGGITLALREEAPGPILNQVIAELRSNCPERDIEVKFQLPESMRCDRGRIAQLFSNLLGNALTHGTADSPVRVFAKSDGENFTLSVSNSGPPIPPEAMRVLFNPFYRSGLGRKHQGLGLGLYIASEIARAHDGVIHATSSQEETCFTFSMPLKEQHAPVARKRLESA